MIKDLLTKVQQMNLNKYAALGPFFFFLALHQPFSLYHIKELQDLMGDIHISLQVNIVPKATKENLNIKHSSLQKGMTVVIRERNPICTSPLRSNNKDFITILYLFLYFSSRLLYYCLLFIIVKYVILSYFDL